MSTDWLGLEGKLVAITGAGGGIGRGLAHAFAQAGARVALLERDATSAEETSAAILASGGIEPVFVPCDISSAESVAAMGDALASQGGADVLVNNAAIMRPGALADLPLAEWNALISVNLTGAFLCSQALGRQMRTKGAGAIVHIASVSGLHPQGLSGAYSVSKAGLIMLSRQLATEWGPEGVRSNVICPGMIETPMTAEFYATPGIREKREALIPARRIGQPRDIAEAALFLASDRAAYLNGEEITVDGAYTRMIMNLVPRPGYDKG